MKTEKIGKWYGTLEKSWKWGLVPMKWISKEDFKKLYPPPETDGIKIKIKRLQP